MKLFRRSSAPVEKKEKEESEKRCIVCTKVINPPDGIQWKKTWICPNCFDSGRIKIEGNCLRLSENELMIQAVYLSGLCPIPTIILNRIEKSPDFSPIVKRGNYTAISRVLGYLVVEPSFKSRISKWNYGGQFDIYDDFESGYTAKLSLEYGDAKFRRILIKLLRKYGFGCLVSEYGAVGHKNDSHPQDDGAKEITDLLLDEINKSGLEYEEPEWSKRHES